METTSRMRLTQIFWERHANPKSGWSRMVTLPVLMYAIHTRRWKTLLSTVVFTVINPILFSKPNEMDAWMTKVVLAERYWQEHDADIGPLNLLNLAGVPVTLYAIYAAYKQNTGGATVATALSMTLKLAFVAALVRRFEDDLTDLDSSLTVTSP